MKAEKILAEQPGYTTASTDFERTILREEGRLQFYKKAAVVQGVAYAQKRM